MSKKYLELFGRVLFGILAAALLLFLLLEPDDEHVPSKSENEKISTEMFE